MMFNPKLNIGDRVIIDGDAEVSAMVLAIRIYGNPEAPVYDYDVEWWNNGNVIERQFDEWRLERRDDR